ncbi:MAG: 50S ribosomal protein L23 [Patescibacteria group bacterium]|jgi:large subunit ribosomal protein L23
MSIFKKKSDGKEDKKPEVKKGEVKDVKEEKKETIKKESEKKSSMKDLYGQEEGKKRSGKGEQASKGKFSQAYKVLVRPLITEKAANLGTENKYGFVVDGGANKISVAKAIEQVYGIKPVKVNIINIKGKKVRSRRLMGKRKDWRKAIVTLPKGKSINIYEGV